MKTPGPDGLTKEFYTENWKSVIGSLAEIFNNALAFQSTCESWNESHVTLIPKKGNTNEIKNWRPISLLNFDYKILTKIIATRLKRIMPKMILQTQKCSVPNRSITDAIRNIDSIREHCNRSNKEKIISNFDQRKAFDLVNHCFMFKILEKMKLGSRIISNIRRLYQRAFSRVNVNGALTEEIQLCRGLRQGCPLSVALYTIVADPLARKINNNEDVIGIKIGKTITKLQQYADDVTTTVKNINSLQIVLDTFRQYEEVTGQQPNEEKTEITTDHYWSKLENQN